MVIFIEGGLSPSISEYYKPKTGAVRLSLITGAPIIPIGFSLIHEKLKTIHTENIKARWYIKGPYAITIGKALKPKGEVEDFDFVRFETQKIMAEIVKLVNESKIRLAHATIK